MVGFGQLARLVDCFAHRLVLEEDLARQVAQALVEHLGARGAACVLDAEQTCLTVRGERRRAARAHAQCFLGDAGERRPAAGALPGAGGGAGLVEAARRALAPRRGRGAVTGGTPGRTAIVTGGGRGIGAATARALTAAGARVTVFGRTAADLEALVRGGGAALAVQGDVDPRGRRGAARRRARAGAGSRATCW